jgi:hypothetical protein
VLGRSLADEIANSINPSDDIDIDTDAHDDANADKRRELDR